MIRCPKCYHNNLDIEHGVYKCLRCKETFEETEGIESQKKYIDEVVVYKKADEIMDKIERYKSGIISNREVYDVIFKMVKLTRDIIKKKGSKDENWR